MLKRASFRFFSSAIKPLFPKNIEYSSSLEYSIKQYQNSVHIQSDAEKLALYKYTMIKCTDLCNSTMNFHYLSALITSIVLIPFFAVDEPIMAFPAIILWYEYFRYSKETIRIQNVMKTQQSVFEHYLESKGILFEVNKEAEQILSNTLENEK